VIPIAYSIRSLFVRKATTLASVLGLAAVVFVFASVTMLANGVRQATRRAVDPNGAIILRAGSAAEIESSIETAAVAHVAAAPGLARCADGRPWLVPELLVLLVLDDDRHSGAVSNVQLRGVPDDVLQFRPSVRVVEGRAARAGTDEAIVGRAIRGRFAGLELGGKLELRKNRPLQIVGVFDDAGSAYESELWAGTDLVQTTFGQQGVVSSVRVRLESERAFEAFRSALESQPELGLRVFREGGFAAQQTQGTGDLSVRAGVCDRDAVLDRGDPGRDDHDARRDRPTAARDRHAACTRLFTPTRAGVVHDRGARARASRGSARRVCVAVDGAQTYLDDQHGDLGRALVWLRAELVDHARRDRQRRRHGPRRRALAGAASDAPRSGSSDARALTSP
jgi:hypothetical protein